MSDESEEDPPTWTVDEAQTIIEQRAYDIWEEEGRPEGRHLAHWEQAKADILDVLMCCSGNCEPLWSMCEPATTTERA